MNYGKISAALFFIIFCFAATAQTIDNPFTITQNTFTELNLKHHSFADDKEGNQYKVINSTIEKGLLIKVNDEWKKHGKYFRYTSGKLTQENSYNSGKKHGKEIRYFSDGQKNWEYEYSEDIKNGPFKIIYQKNGQICQEGTYKNGKKDGEEIYRYETGIKKQVKTYQNGKVIRAAQYNSEGVKISDNTYN